MSKHSKALKLALEALNELIPDVHDWYGAKVHRANAAITAIREALVEQPAQQRPQNCGTGYCSCIECPYEQPAQEPKKDLMWSSVSMQERHEQYVQRAVATLERVKQEQLAEQPAQEPVAKVISTAPERIWLDLGFDPEAEDEVSFDDLFDATWSHDNATGNGIEYVRADLAPASKPWVGLTFAEICECENDYLHIFARAIEAKLREKNAQPSKPLTDEQRFEAFARAEKKMMIKGHRIWRDAIADEIEAAHGIKGDA